MPAVSAHGAVPDVKKTRRIAHHGVEWHFDRPHQAGTFANGDPWVVGPVVIVRITPDYDGAGNGWEVNPRVQGPQGFDRAAGEFDPALVPSLPYRAHPEASIVKTVHAAAVRHGINRRECIETAAVLTVVATIPPGGGASVFRPPYVGTRKTWYATNSLATEALPSLPAVRHTPSLAWVEASFRPVQLDHKQGRVGRNLHPKRNIPDYGADIARRNGDAALRLMLDDPIERKRPALIAYVQYGIDLYHMLLEGHRWPAGGGHRPGQKLPLAFAAVMLRDDGMREAVVWAKCFHEDQFVYRSEKNGQSLYGSAPDVSREKFEKRYWEALYTHVREGKARGYKSYRDPYGFIDGGCEPGALYQHCCTSQPWKGEALACHLMPALKTLWGHPAYFEYVDRWVELGAWTQPDMCAPPDTSWDRYGVTFGPDGNGGCVCDDDSSDGIGRFPEHHGIERDGGGRYSRFQAAMWQAYRQSAHTLTNTYRDD